MEGRPALSRSLVEVARGRFQTRYPELLDAAPRISRTQEALLYFALAKQDVDDQEYAEAIAHALRSINSAKSSDQVRAAVELLCQAELARIYCHDGYSTTNVKQVVRENIHGFIKQGCPHIRGKKLAQIQEQLVLFCLTEHERNELVKQQLFHIFENGSRSLLDRHVARHVPIAATYSKDTLKLHYHVHFIADKREDRIVITCRPPQNIETHPVLINTDSTVITCAKANDTIMIEEQHGAVTTMQVFKYQDTLPANQVDRLEAVLKIVQAATSRTVSKRDSFPMR